MTHDLDAAFHAWAATEDGAAILASEQEPALRGFFETRELRGGEPDPEGMPHTCRACAGQAATHAPGCAFSRGPQGDLFA